MRIPRPCFRITGCIDNFQRCYRHGRYSPATRIFHTTAHLGKIKPFLLPDIGEGITEVQIIQWFVEPEARVEQFDKLCEVQSDKAAAEITSRFDGVIKKLYYEAEDMAQVGKPLCDIDTYDDALPDEEAVVVPSPEVAGSASTALQQQNTAEQHPHVESAEDRESKELGKHAALATPAVRGLLKELKVDIAHVTGTGKDGRVMKDDVYRFAAARDSDTTESPASALPQLSRTSTAADEPQIETPLTLTPIQSQMFKTMTRSLTIPHFQYADEINLTPLTALRQRLNTHNLTPEKLSFLPFIIKAVSLALTDFPLLNSRIETNPSTQHPHLLTRKNHNIGIAMDTPQGLLVPNIKNVSALSILAIASELSRLHHLATTGALAIKDISAGTITVSNIGSIGGTYVAPVIVPSEVAILGVGRARTVPAFDDEGVVVRREQACFSWSADHRVVDGATMARMADRVRVLLEEPGFMVVGLR